MGGSGQLDPRNICQCHAAAGHSIFKQHLYNNVVKCKCRAEDHSAAAVPHFAQKTRIMNASVILGFFKDPPPLWANCFKMLNHLHGEFFFPYVQPTFSFLPPVTVSPLVLCWAPGRRVGFPPSVACQTLPPLLAGQPDCPLPPLYPFCGAWMIFYSVEALTPRSLSCGEGVEGTPGRPSPQGRQRRAPSLAFKTLQHFSVILFSFGL